MTHRRSGNNQSISIGRKALSKMKIPVGQPSTGNSKDRGESELETRIALIAPIEKSHALPAQFRTETKYASLLG